MNRKKCYRHQLRISDCLFWHITKQQADDIHNYIQISMSKYFHSDQFEDDQVIVSCSIRHSWLGHGLFSGVASLFTTISIGMPVTHWWVAIQTNKAYYNSQFYGFNDSFLTLTKHDSHDKTDVAGTGKDLCEKKIMTYDMSTVNKKKMKDVLDFMQKWNPNYNLLTNNCQHFSRRLFWLLTAQEEENFIKNCGQCLKEIKYKDISECLDCRSRYSPDCFRWMTM